MNYDEDQINAIKSLENTLVIAGAGSGKTSTIVGKVFYLIENKIYEPKEILIISFTNETVKSLKSKIKYNIDIKTFHKLALDIINLENKFTIINNSYLSYIINEYLNSYALYDKKTNKSYLRILQNMKESNLKILIKTFINIYKSNYPNINKLLDLYKNSFFISKIYYKLILDIYLIYQRELEATQSLDFNDLLIFATDLIKNDERKTHYKYIIIDEFQDTSFIRFNLIIGIINKNSAKLFAVGDDYQSIYRFSGCDLSLFINFTKFLPNTKLIYLNHNYRNSQDLINIANNFIMKNKKQIKKNTICHKNINKSIKIVFYIDKTKIINNVLNLIEGNTLILGRNNQDKDSFNVKETSRVRFLTIHKAKGLEEDNIILINLDNSTLGLPTKIKNEKIVSKILKNDYIIYEEERRIFYVALTRTKNFIYLLVPKYNYSIFIHELIHYNKKKLDFIHID